MLSQTFWHLNNLFVTDSTSNSEIINKTANIIDKNCNHFIIDALKQRNKSF